MIPRSEIHRIQITEFVKEVLQAIYLCVGDKMRIKINTGIHTYIVGIKRIK